MLDEAKATKSAASTLVRRSEMVRRVARDLGDRDGGLNDAILALDGITLALGFGLGHTTEQGVAAAARAAAEAASRAIDAVRRAEMADPLDVPAANEEEREPR